MAKGCFKLTVAAVWKADWTRDETGRGANKGSWVTLSIKDGAWEKSAFVDGVVRSAKWETNKQVLDICVLVES